VKWKRKKKKEKCQNQHVQQTEVGSSPSLDGQMMNADSVEWCEERSAPMIVGEEASGDEDFGKGSENGMASCRSCFPFHFRLRKITESWAWKVDLPPPKKGYSTTTVPLTPPDLPQIMEV